jgi:hypothetical protein
LRKDAAVIAGRLASALASSFAADGNMPLQMIVDLALWRRLPERIKSSSDLLFKPVALFGNIGHKAFGQLLDPSAAVRLGHIGQCGCQELPRSGSEDIKIAQSHLPLTDASGFLQPIKQLSNAGSEVLQEPFVTFAGHQFSPVSPTSRRQSGISSRRLVIKKSFQGSIAATSRTPKACRRIQYEHSTTVCSILSYKLKT